MIFGKHLINIFVILFCCIFLQPFTDGMAEAKTKKSVHKISQVKKNSPKSVASRKATVNKAKKLIDEEQGNSEKNVWLQRASKSEVFTGKASWYGKDFHNKKTASGVKYNMHTFTAAHRTLPMGTVVKVTDQLNGKSVMVCVTDRGPFVRDRIIDLSYAAAKKLNLEERGVGKVALEVVSDTLGKPLSSDKAYFVKYKSDNGRTSLGPFTAFADAAVMQEALAEAHTDVEVVLEKVKGE